MDLTEFLGFFNAGRVLDLATGRGGNIQHLLESLREITEVIGVDINPKMAENFEQQFIGKPVSFRVMDASQLEFPDGSFDTVSIGNSLHHLQQLPVSLGEMLRVLKPGGHLIIQEMYRDTEIESQLTHVLLHHWWAAVDTAHGIPHYETFTRVQLRRLIESLSLVGLKTMDIDDRTSNAFEPETLQKVGAAIDQYIEKAADHEGLVARGEALRQRLARTGFLGAPALLAIGKKPE